MTSRTVLLTLCGCLAILGGCVAGETAMTETSFNGFCLMSGMTGHGSCDTGEVCGEYQTVVSVKYSSLEACIAACDAVNNQRVLKNALNRCGSVDYRTHGYCVQFCRSNY